LRAELELLLNLNVWDYVKPEFEKIKKEGLQESLVAYEDAAKRANNPDGA
jgi:hypothetical protein